MTRMSWATHLLAALILSMCFSLATDIEGLPAFTMASVAAVYSLLPDLDLRFKHRFMLHNLFAMVILTLPLARMAAGQHAVIGYASHLLLDSVTRTGVCWDYPIGKACVKGRVRTGGAADRALAAVMAAVLIGLVASVAGH